MENRTINLVRCVPAELHTALKILAAKQGKSLIAVCVEALKNHIKSTK